MARERIKPGRGGPKLVQVPFRLTERQRQALKDHAASRGVTMSDVIRQMIDDLLLDEQDD